MFKTNLPPALEAQVEFITAAIKEAEKGSKPLVEATHEAEREYSKLCEDLAKDSLFWKATVSRGLTFDPLKPVSSIDIVY